MPRCPRSYRRTLTRARHSVAPRVSCFTMDSRYVARPSRTAALSSARVHDARNPPTPNPQLRTCRLSRFRRLASLALATRGHERIARSLRARALAPSARGRRERPGDFPPRARSTGARAPPRSTLTSIPSSLSCCLLDRRLRARGRETSALCAAAAARFLHSRSSRTTQGGGAVPRRMLLVTPAPSPRRHRSATKTVILRRSARSARARPSRTRVVRSRLRCSPSTWTTSTWMTATSTWMAATSTWIDRKSVV